MLATGQSALSGDVAKPRFSIIIPTFNAGAKLESSLRSVLTQATPFECLVIDGGSEDCTTAVVQSAIQEYFQVPTKFVSEPDTGIYDAMNKGIALSCVQFLYFLGAGDRLRPGALEQIAETISDLRARRKTDRPLLLYGNVMWTGHGVYDGRFSRFKLLRHNICHQAIFYERTIFDRFGPFNTAYRTCADYELNLRCFGSNKIRKIYLDAVIADYEGGGVSAGASSDPRFCGDFEKLIEKHLGKQFRLLLKRPRALQPRRLVREFLARSNQKK